MLSQFKPRGSSEGGVSELTIILRRDIFVSCSRCHTPNAKHEPLERVHTLLFLNKEKFHALSSNKSLYRCTVCGNQIET